MSVGGGHFGAEARGKVVAVGLPCGALQVVLAEVVARTGAKLHNLCFGQGGNGLICSGGGVGAGVGSGVVGDRNGLGGGGAGL